MLITFSSFYTCSPVGQGVGLLDPKSGEGAGVPSRHHRVSAGLEEGPLDGVRQQGAVLGEFEEAGVVPVSGLGHQYGSERRRDGHGAGLGLTMDGGFGWVPLVDSDL